MNQRELREQAYEANLALVRHGLVIFTWGNASVFDAASGLMAIKPSGVAYEKLGPDNIVLLDVESGKTVDSGNWRPSSDTATHRVLYRAFPGVGGIIHTHSRLATAWAQAGRDLPCYGTTHADYFHGPVPCTAEMTEAEVNQGEGYEHNTGVVIVREFQQRGLNPLHVPAVLVRGHAPFAWGSNGTEAVHNAVVLEEVAGMALHTLVITAQAAALPYSLLQKHFSRKHGANAYYGQNL